MKKRVWYGMIAALGCLVVPLLSRAPRGSDWVAQYLPGAMFFGAFALIPGIVVFVAFLVSKEPLYLPGVLATIIAYALLVVLHYDNDLSADAQAAFTLMIFPVIVAGVAVIAGGIGYVVQAVVSLRR